ncbi:thioredoxin domain-containing protein [Acanthopleuribacter pedis]|uniref:Thioredoxin domain-containing protein n=1 Tax=Acanthopleuribacter pedis TaxID=442870 RepID=A0A8J7QNH9_9BACT|nr:thioredoxin domain-containing protein [Acanthopleuribacter pedis]MBO1321683.1 thioredoxin domain-containing protein [Acanthopleuribacter pedis]
MSGHQRPTLPSDEAIQQLPADGGPDYNRLIFESSPYLLQHAANPVDWFPWGEEAFAVARERDVPIFLSIGYATCHWCHVMEHESFENEAAAKLLNEHFVAVKVDKEERPDIDDIYMTACLAMNGQGGWPLTALLNHDRQPFFTGTYFPLTGAGRRPGMLELIPRVGEFWQSNREEVLKNAQQLTNYIAGQSSVEPAELHETRLLQKAYEQLKNLYDPRNGGFSGAPKFPTPHQFMLLVRAAKRFEREDALTMCRHTLHHMARGGIFDQVGFGFHRYSTDPYWLLPHFEKMLYDQAMMAIALLETGALAEDPELHAVARRVFTYVQRDMTDPGGGFYCAEDADSEGVEGKFYVWKPAEVIDILGESDGALYNAVYNLTEEGNFHEEATGHKTGDNIPHLIRPLAELAEEQGLGLNLLEIRLQRCREKLFEAREKRIHPLKDDKILTDWNGLMIAAFALGARILGEPDYLAQATRAADYIHEHLRDENGRLLKRARRGQAGLTGLIDDYAFMIWGLLEIYRAGFDAEYLARAVALCDTAVEHFHDEESGAFYLTPDDGEPLIVRGQKIYDGAIPSGNAVLAWCLIRLARLTGETRYEGLGIGVCEAFGASLRTRPAGHNMSIIAYDLHQLGSREIVVHGDRDSDDTQALLAEINRHYQPFDEVLLVESETAPITKLASYTRDQKRIDDQATVYVCHNFTCENPVTSPEALAEILSKD